MAQSKTKAGGQPHADRIDHDQLFKRLLKEFFVEFVELFLPAVREYLEPSTIKFLDKEIFTDLKASQRQIVDLVAQAEFKGQKACFLIHVEPQASRRRKRGEFAERMFYYFAGLSKDSGLPVYPVAILSYDQPRNLEADIYRVEFPDKTVLEFRYTVIQLNQLNWRDFLRHDNPVASALMAKMGFTPEERVEVKKECLRMIARLKLDPDKTKQLAKFVDTYLRLNAEEKMQFKAAIQKLPDEEQEATMEYMTSWEEEGWHRGLEKGLEKGLQKGLEKGLDRERELIKRQLIRRIGQLSKRAQASIARLSAEQMEGLGEALLDFTQARDLSQWLSEHAAPASKPNVRKAG